VIIRTHALARIGLLGNPSDGYFGKTISCAIANFRAQVRLWESPRLQLVPNPEHDPTEFDSLPALVEVAQRNGYYGGLRLLLATVKKFHEYCAAHGLTLPARNFTLTYDTNIPRQVGLGGSSAIITAALRALMQFYELTDRELPLPIQPNVVLSVETEELEIAAGLQDRVIQAYGGTVFMDFDRALMAQQGFGSYVRLDPKLLPPLFLAYLAEGSESGRVHGNLRNRYEQGEPAVLGAIQRWAEIANEGKTVLERGEHRRLADLMNENFDVRRRILGDAVIGAANLELIEVARRLGRPAKFSGSGGAVVGTYETPEQFEQLAIEYGARGHSIVAVTLDGV